jgi:hypothetical protein
MCVCSDGIIERLCWNWWFQCVLKLLNKYMLKLVVSRCECVLLELSDSWYAGIVTACEVCVHAKMWVVCSELTFVAELGVQQRNFWFAAETVSAEENYIRCQNWDVCSKIMICCRSCVVWSELTFAAESCVLQWNCDSLSKLCCP